MCGISGAFAYHSHGPVDQTLGRAVRDFMAPRGPDGSGEWLAAGGDVWLGHRRLAIIDLSPSGAQPMQSKDGGLVLTFNGEIYNYVELRQRLIAGGAKFQSTSDSEVILQLYRSEGPDSVSQLRGMFAFALWDERHKKLVLARDPYGIKPLYYSVIRGPSGPTFVFASQVKALVADHRVSRQPDPAGVTGFFLLGSVPEPWTLYRDIKSVPAGSMLIVDHHGVRAPQSYHSIGADIRRAEEEASAGLPGEPTGVLREALLDSVRHHLVADVPVGAFLSAGVDSGALVGLMRDAGQNEIRTVTLAYDEYLNGISDEAPLAAETARRYGTSHTTRRVTAEEFHADLPRILAAMDQPSVDGINTWFVSKAAHELGLKVAISGVGGDELLGGYSTFSTLPRFAALTKLAVGLRVFSGLLERSVSSARRHGVGLHPKWAALLRYGGGMAGAYLMQRSLFLPNELHALLADPEFVRDGLEQFNPLRHVANTLSGGPRSRYGQVAVMESSFYLRNQLLRDTDWAAMAHSLEVRTPLVDHVLLRHAAAVMAAPQRPDGKLMLANAPHTPLPSSLVNRAKSGFGIPVQAWLAREKTELSKWDVCAGMFSRQWACLVASRQNASRHLAQQEILG